MSSKRRCRPGRVAISLAISLVLVSSVSAAARRPDALDRAPGVQLDVGGVVGERLRAVTQNWLLRAPDDNPAMLAMFADRDKQPYRDLLPWSGEFAGKYLTAATQVLRLTGDAKLKAR